MRKSRLYADVAALIPDNLAKMQFPYTPDYRLPQFLSDDSFQKDLFQNELIDDELDGVTEFTADDFDYLDDVSCDDRVNVLNRSSASGKEIIFINYLTHEKLTFHDNILRDNVDFTTGEKLEVVKDDYQNLLEQYSLSLGDIQIEREYPDLPPVVVPVTLNAQQNLCDLNRNVVSFKNVLTEYSRELQKIRLFTEQCFTRDKLQEDINSLLLCFTESKFLITFFPLLYTLKMN